MNRISLSLLTCLTVLASGCVSVLPEEPADETVPAMEQSSPYIEGIANVLLSEELAQMMEASESDVFDRLGVTSYRRLFPDAGEYEPRTRKAGLHRWYKITYDTNLPLTKAEEDFCSIPGVEKFEPERQIRQYAFFDDPKISHQWHYYNDGTISSDFMSGSDINVVDVWTNYTVGDRSVVVAVLDGGVDYEHEDIAANYVGGKNFGTGGKILPDDHGTHVAGTIAAVSNNGKGGAGIAGGNAAAGIPGVGILSCQIFAGSNLVGGAEALKWAADNGAVIANNSWGYAFATEEDAKNASISSELAAAIDYFITYAGCDNDGNQLPDSPMKGGVVLFSAGNDGYKYNPIGEYEPVVAVGAIGPDYKRAYYSCYGDWVDIAAPGGTAQINRGMVYSAIAGNKYDYMQGTSMSCPHVSGVAALIASYFGGPGFSNDMLLERLLKGARHDALHVTANIGPLVDALGSFTMGGTKAPEKVDDFDLDALGDKITLKVKVTADEDDIKTFEYVVLMAENPALLEDINIKALPEGLRKFRFKVGALAVGDVLDMVIPDLEFEKEYWFALAGCDYSLNYSEFSPVKSVKTGRNQAPVITPTLDLGEIVVKPFESFVCDFEIMDPEGDEISVQMKESRSGLSLQKKSGTMSVWTLTIIGSVAKPGAYGCVILASDRHGAVTECSFDYTVLENSAPVSLRKFDDLLVVGKDKVYVFDLSEYFNDPDGEKLAYKVSGSNMTVTKNEVNGDNLSLTVVGYGLNILKITAYDQRKTGTSLELRMMAKDPENLVEMYPVPVTDVLNIRTGEICETEIVIKSASGHVVHSEKESVSAFDPAVVDMSHCAPGRYKVSVIMNGEVTERMITKI